LILYKKYYFSSRIPAYGVSGLSDLFLKPGRFELEHFGLFTGSSNDDIDNAIACVSLVFMPMSGIVQIVVIASMESRSGVGSILMNHIKVESARRSVTHMMAYVDYIAEYESFFTRHGFEESRGKNKLSKSLYQPYEISFAGANLICCFPDGGMSLALNGRLPGFENTTQEEAYRSRLAMLKIDSHVTVRLPGRSNNEVTLSCKGINHETGMIALNPTMYTAARKQISSSSICLHVMTSRIVSVSTYENELDGIKFSGDDFISRRMISQLLSAVCTNQFDIFFYYKLHSIN
jgi:N-acetylglutamate synthase-like GNAT family acetyltransferase